MNPLIIKILILTTGVITMTTGFTLNHFRIGNKDIRYISTAIGVGIAVFALVQLSVIN